MADQVPASPVQDDAVLPDDLGTVRDGHHPAYMPRADPRLDWLPGVPEEDDPGRQWGPEKALAFYLVALWQAVTWSDVAENWGRARPSRRPHGLRVAGGPQAR